MKPCIKDLSFQKLKSYLNSIGETKYRFHQITNWLYKKYALSFDEMTDIKKTLREKLRNEFDIISLKLIKRIKDNDTEKFLFACRDGHHIESVLIRDGDRRTICISTQIGCKLKCAFCRTGKIPFIRNLTISEILDQFILVNKSILPREKLTNIVFMGMGEPLLNYKNVVSAIKIIEDNHGLAFSGRRITISTAGLIPEMKKLAKENLNINIAISLNAADDEKRSYLMPINKNYPLKELLKVAKQMPIPRRRRITFEYILIKDITDSLKDAEKLVNLLKGFKCKVNLIRYNPTENDKFSPPDEKRVKEFEAYLWAHGITTFVRKSKGKNIKAGCGQLAADYL